MIQKSSGNPNSPPARRKIDQLYTCVRYCEDEFRCRRTMQLEFFGETFDRSKCNNSCDNCKAKRVPDRKDMTDVAKVVLDLLSDIQRQKGTRVIGTTMVQLANLYKGSKSQSATKFLRTSDLRGYGHGSALKKHELDRLFHALVFDRVLREISEVNKSGFNSDYVHPGDTAQAIQSGQRRFIIEVPKDVPKPVKEKKTTKGKTKSTSTKSPKTSSAAAKRTTSSTINVDSDDDDDDDDDDVSWRGSGSGSKKQAPSTFPAAKTKELVEVFKKLVSNWADEERLLGNEVFYWNILNGEAMKAIAAGAPITLDELKGLGVLGENIIKEYGERIVKVVAHFVNTNVDMTMASDDEFGGDGIDFSAIPDCKPATAGYTKGNQSKYFKN
jgi:superfamily II DNA helicase RecQ